MFNKAFRKKIFLKPLPNGSFEAIDITDNEEFVQKELGSATVLNPALIVPVSGIKNIAYIAIKKFNSAELFNPYNEQVTGISEKTLWNIIDESAAYGRDMVEGTGEEGKKEKSKANITMIAAIAAAIFAVMIYLKLPG